MRISVNIPKPQCKFAIGSPELAVLCDMIQDQLEELFCEHEFSVRVAGWLLNPRFVNMVEWPTGVEFPKYTEEDLQSLYDECLEEWMQIVE